MESPPTPLRLPRITDRPCPDRTAERPPPPSTGECRSEPTLSSVVLPQQSTAPTIEHPEMSWKSAEDISARIRQDGIRHLLTGRAAGNPAGYSYGGSALMQSLILGAASIRTKDVP